MSRNSRAKESLDLENASIPSVSEQIANAFIETATASFGMFLLGFGFFVLNWIVSLSGSFPRSLLSLGLLLVVVTFLGSLIQIQRHRALDEEIRYLVLETIFSPESTEEWISCLSQDNGPLSGLAQAPIPVEGNIEPPRKIVDVAPAYPEQAVQARIQGVVVIEAIIDSEGNVIQARVVRSVPPLDEAALDAVRRWKYEPTQQDGVPVPVIMTVTLNFELD